MYRKQMKFQKLVCFALLAASALVFIYSLGLVTDLYDAFYYAIPNPNRLDRTDVEGSRIFYDIQPFNSALTTVSIILIILCFVVFLTNTHSRRKYYLSNYISTGIISVANVGIAVWGIINVSKFRHQFLTTVNFEQLKAFTEKSPNAIYTESTFWFDIGYVVFGILIIVSALAVYNLILKSKLMKEEQRIIEGGV